MVDPDGSERQDRRSNQLSDARNDVCRSSPCIRSARLYRVLRFRYTYGYITSLRRGRTPEFRNSGVSPYTRLRSHSAIRSSSVMKYCCPVLLVFISQRLKG